MKYIYTHGHSLWKSSWLLVMLIFLTIMAYAAVETKNLLRNGDFEESGTPLPGWKINTSPGESYELTSNALTGKNALKISLPVAGGTQPQYPTRVDVTPGEDYLFTYWGRGDGGTKGHSYDGCYAIVILYGRMRMEKIWEFFNRPCLTAGTDYRAVTYVRLQRRQAPQSPWLIYIFILGKDYKGPVVAFL